LGGVSLGGASVAGGVAELELNASVSTLCESVWTVVITSIINRVFVIWLDVRAIIGYTEGTAFLVIDRDVLKVLPAEFAMGSELNGYQQIRDILSKGSLYDVLSEGSESFGDGSSSR